MQIINCIKRDFSNAIRKRCYERGCLLNLKGLNIKVVLKGEEVCENIKICDCIIFTIRNIIGIVELTKTLSDSKEIVEKLNNGTNIASKILENYNNIQQRNFEFYHIVLFNKCSHHSEIKVIRNSKIKVRGINHDIFPARCGYLLSRLIS